ncbi:MAG: nicotinate (nicotinamide) nucleotide adenylyltransferase [Sulfurimonas sp.]|jgi:nicotinate-nucleotide adenylyltransferase
METIALFGGSFDPPHIGHVAIVRALLHFRDVNKVVIMPTYINPFKQRSHAPAVLRLEWLKKIFSSYKNVEIDNFEVNHAQKVSTIVSVKHLLKKHKKVYLIIGADNLSSLHMWDRYEELHKLVTIVVAGRSKIDIPKKFLTLNIDENISSSELREHMDISKLPKECAVEISEYYKENNEK